MWAGLLFVVLLIAAFLFGRRRSAPVAIGVAIWAIFFLPVANLVFPVGTLMAERLAYLPSLGGCLVVGHLTAGLAARRRGYGRAVAAACLVAVVALSVRTVVRNGVWSSNASLALNDARVNPDSAKLHAGAGIAAFDLGERRRAEEAFRRAVEIYPDYAQVHFNLGQLLREEDRHAEAIEHLARAASLSDNPRPLQSLKELAVELEANGRAVDAVQAYAALERLLPSDYGTRFNHGRLLLALGQRQRASEVLSRLADDDAQGIPGQLAAALVAQLAGRPDEATRRFRELLTRRDLPPAIRARVEGLLAELEAD